MSDGVTGTGRDRVAGRPVPAPERSRRDVVIGIICLAAAVLGSAAAVALRWLVPLNVMGLSAGYYDDGLFERSAVALASRTWLGSFDIVTLSKGPSYPMFVAAAGRLGLPLQVAEQLTYLLAAAGIATCFWLLTRRLVATTAVYMIVAVDPVNFLPQARVLRDSWYSGLSLLFFALVFLTTLLVTRRARLHWSLLVAVLTGLTGAAFWLCREEGSWIVPSAVVVVAGLAVVARRTRSAPTPGSGRTARRALGVALVVAIAGVTLYAPIAYVGAKNERVYGVNMVTDFAGGAFPTAYAAWSRVRGVPLRQYVPIDQAQREAVYEVSPAARELRPFLEGAPAGWKLQGCASLGVCDDYAGGWAPWAIRQAALDAGHFGSEADFQAYFSRLTAEINAACDDGRLDCAMKLPASLQLFQAAEPIPTIKEALVWLGRLPVSSAYDSAPADLSVPFPVSDEDRAFLQRAFIGVPTSQEDAAAQFAKFGSYRWMYDWLGIAFRVGFVLLLAMAVIGLVLGGVWRRERPRNPGLWVLSAGLGVGIAVRLVLFGVLGTTQYAVDPRYHYPTRAFLLVLAAMGAVNLVHVVRAHRDSRRLGVRTPHPTADSGSDAPVVADDGEPAVGRGAVG